MKNLIFIALLAVFTFNATAQEKPEPIKTTEVKANHNTSRSNKKPGGVADLNTDTGNDQAGLAGKRKCVKSGGTFYEFPNGTTKCVPARVSSVKSQALPNEEMEGGLSDRKKCLKSGGVWTTNSHGTFCFKRLESSQKL